MSEITLFENDEFRLEITPHAVDGFHVTAPPLARQLGYRDAADMLRTVPEDEKGYELVRTAVRLPWVRKGDPTDAPAEVVENGGGAS